PNAPPRPRQQPSSLGRIPTTQPALARLARAGSLALFSPTAETLRLAAIHHPLALRHRALAAHARRHPPRPPRPLRRLARAFGLFRRLSARFHRTDASRHPPIQHSGHRCRPDHLGRPRAPPRPPHHRLLDGPPGPHSSRIPLSHPNLRPRRRLHTQRAHHGRR